MLPCPELTFEVRRLAAGVDIIAEPDSGAQDGRPSLADDMAPLHRYMDLTRFVKVFSLKPVHLCIPAKLNTTAKGGCRETIAQKQQVRRIRRLGAVWAVAAHPAFRHTRTIRGWQEAHSEHQLKACSPNSNPPTPSRLPADLFLPAAHSEMIHRLCGEFST